MIVTTGAVVLADITTPERRGRIISIYQGTFIFGVGIGPLPGGLLAELYGLSAPFWFCGGASVIASTVALFAVKETRHLARAKESKHGVRPTFVAQIRLLSKNTGFVLVSSIALINALTRTGGLFNIIPIIGSFKLGLSVAEIGFGMALGSILGLVATYPSGMIADRWGRKAVIVPVTIMTGTSFLLFLAADSLTTFAGAYVLWGVASSIGGSAPAAYAADSAPPGMNASAMSMFRMLGDIGYVVGPIALGYIVDVQGPDTALILCTILLVLIAAAFAKFAPETYRAG